MQQKNVERTGNKNGFTIEIKNKIKHTIEKNKLNNPNYTIDKILKIKQTKYLRYNNENYNNVEKCKKTKLLKYGTSNYNNRQSAEKTMIKKYGVKNYAQTHYAIKRHKNNIKYDNILFDSKLELAIYQFCKTNKLNVIYKPKISFQYYVKNKIHFYFPDFIINNKVYEAKGNHFFRKNILTNQIEMYCPFRNKQWTDEQYKNVCFQYNEKYKCMCKNNVTIILSTDINKLDKILIS